MSPTPDSTLADPAQIIADLQRKLEERTAERDDCKAERDEYKAERDEALDREAATAEVLQVINRSPGDLAPVFDAMLEKATRLCEAPFGILRTWDGERFHFGAVHGEPRFRDWVRQRHPLRQDGDGSPLGRIVAGERVVSLADALGDEGYRASASFREMAETSGLRSAIWVALHKDDALLGSITVYRQEVRPFSDKQIALLENFAAQAVIAMENARLLTETREALEQQTATAEVLQIINSSPGDLAPVFDAMLEKATRLCEAPFGLVRTWDGEHFHLAAANGDPKFTEWAWSYGPFAPTDAHSQLGRIVSGKLEVVRFADARGEEAHSTFPDFRAFVDASGMRSGVKRRAAQGRYSTWHNHCIPSRSPAVFGQADRVIAKLRRASGYRDRECAAPDRDARGSGAADRDRRGAGGHQQLARRPFAGIRVDLGEGA